MTQRLHPTIRACSCGFIGTKSQLYHHFGEWTKQYTTSKEFFSNHGEVPINEDDPRTQLSVALAVSLEKADRKKLIESI